MVAFNNDYNIKVVMFPYFISMHNLHFLVIYFIMIDYDDYYYLLYIDYKYQVKVMNA